jgi:hypothetical protein|tara:strand:+ start:449 stop:649 length:201 start_codon:yes stop_codon:yes gene_type:complete
MKVLVGEFTFLEAVRDGIEQAITHNAFEIEVAEDYDIDLLLNKYEGYLVPSVYTYPIIDSQIKETQ